MQHLGNLNFGFRIHYNKFYKPEYLPARVRYNQFFFFSILAIGLYRLKSSVSISSITYHSCCKAHLF
jgi:hypothetical protein